MAHFYFDCSNDMFLFAFPGKMGGPTLIKLCTKLADIPTAVWIFAPFQESGHSFNVIATKQKFCLSNIINYNFIYMDSIITIEIVFGQYKIVPISQTPLTHSHTHHYFSETTKRMNLKLCTKVRIML